MDRTHMLLAFLIGVVAGLRSMTAPAVVAFAAHSSWLELHRTPLAFMGATPTVIIFIALAATELVVDKLPTTPSRLAPTGLAARTISGALSGASIAAAAAQSVPLGAVLGVAGGIAGAFVGHSLRSRLVRRLKVPDWVIALLGDAIAVGGGLFIVWPS
jgi:uncharacterized membrane protein